VTDPPPAALARPGTDAGRRAFVITPFAKVARAHAAATMADAMVAASLAGSLFFTLPAGDARAPVLRYLLITMLPFAVISPLIGPAIDRMQGGHRLMVIASTVSRVGIAYLLIGQIKGQSPVFYLLALCLLVCQKAYQVARSALVPTVVESDAELVEANSKLSLISGISGFVGVVPAGILLKLLGAQWSVGLAMCTYAVASVLAVRIPASRVAVESADETERHELRGASIVMAGSAMGLIRASVGFLTLLVAFDFRGGDRPTWQFGLVGGASVLSQLAGAALAPRLRKLTSEENILTGVLALMVVAGVFSLMVDDVLGAMLLGSSVGFAAGGGKLAFDSILQRDAPDANRGRAFARFETRFQVTWVIGALLPVWIHLGARPGFVVVLVVALVALGSYVVARGAYAHRTGTHQNAATAAAVEIEERFSEVSGEVRGRLAQAGGAAVRRFRGGRAPAAGADPAWDDEPYDEEAQPQWADAPTAGVGEAPAESADDHARRRGRPRRADGPVDLAHGPTDPDPVIDLAAGSPVAWHPGAELGPPPADEGVPWEPPLDAPPADYLDDLDPSVANPFPWTPDEDPPA